MDHIVVQLNFIPPMLLVWLIVRVEMLNRKVRRIEEYLWNKGEKHEYKQERNGKE